MESSAEFLLTLGGILLLGLLTTALSKYTLLPRVTLLLIFGSIIGDQMLDIIPHVFSERFDLIADMTLLMVGFLLGGKLTKDFLKGSARKVIQVSISAALGTTLIVTSGLILAGVSVEISILLGCIAAATAPAAVMDVVTESGKSNKFSKLLLSIVALDDAWALILFGLGMAFVSGMNGLGGDANFVMKALAEIGGAIVLGLAIGLPASYLTGRVKQGKPTLTEALGLVLVCGGLALWLGVSYLIAAMVMGAVVANLAGHHEFTFHEIEGIEWPLMVVFFVLAGASLDFAAFKDIGWIGIVYILCRSIGKYLGATFGCYISSTGNKTKNWLGAALLPQAGVAIGLALVASHHIPEIQRQVLLTIVIGSTVIFEIIGPVFTRLALQRVNDA